MAVAVQIDISAPDFKAEARDLLMRMDVGDCDPVELVAEAFEEMHIDGGACKFALMFRILSERLNVKDLREISGAFIDATIAFKMGGKP